MESVFNIHYIYTDSSVDDVLRIQRTEDGDFRVTMRFRDNVDKTYEAFMSRHQVMDLVTNTLNSITYDKEPIESIQVFTLLAPSIMYSVEDLYDRSVRSLITDILYNALNVEVQTYKTN